MVIKKIVLLYKYLEIGNRLMARITAPLSFVLMVFTFLKVNNFSSNPFIVLIALFFMVIISTSFGYMYDRLNFYKVEMNLDYNRMLQK
jgi:hypothetical protein